MIAPAGAIPGDGLLSMLNRIEEAVDRTANRLNWVIAIAEAIDLLAPSVAGPFLVAPEEAQRTVNRMSFLARAAAEIADQEAENLSKAVNSMTVALASAPSPAAV